MASCLGKKENKKKAIVSGNSQAVDEMLPMKIRLKKNETVANKQKRAASWS